MRNLILVYTLFFSMEIFAAQLKCGLDEYKKQTDFFYLPISIEGDLATFKFSRALVGLEFEGAVEWDTKYIVIKLKKKSDELGVVSVDIWQNPIQEVFALTHGESKISCRIDVADGLSWKWKESRANLVNYISVINSSVDSLSNLARVVPLPSEEAQLHSGICLLIGNLQHSFQFNELRLFLLRLESHRELFPDAYSYYEKASLKIWGLMNFCVTGLINDPEPITYQDRLQLDNRCKEIKEMNSSLLNYLDRQFPNK